MKKYDVAILGGGIAGLAAAYRLSKHGKKIILIEKSEELGGILRSVKINEYFIEAFYHHIFPTSRSLIKLIKEIGLEKKLTWQEASTAFYYQNKFYKLSRPLDLFSFKPLNFIEKIKLGVFLIRLKLIRKFEHLDNILASEFIIKNAGSSLYEKFFRPLLFAKYGKNLHKISAAWFVKRINTRNKRGRRGEILGYLEGGFEILIKKLIEEIKLNRGEIVVGKEVSKIECENNQAVSVIFDSETVCADYFISTIPGPVLSKIGNFPDDYKDKLCSLRNQGAICVLMGLKKQITDFYWTNLIKEDAIFGAMVEHTNFQSLLNYKEHIVYLASYPDEFSDLWALPENELFEKYFVDIQKVVSIKRDDVNWYRITKDKETGLIYSEGVLKNILPVQSPFKNLFIAGMLNSYPDRGLEQSINLSNQAVNLILNN